ncbi:MAG: lysozyme inhibitor LprI family protein [Helicobacteraceae bacterium]|nr:lysozyme inhibitor LprI family protein [Helicobacteraceae bacterium]
MSSERAKTRGWTSTLEVKMLNRQILALVSTFWLFIASDYAFASSRMEYVEKARESWRQQNELMEKSYNRLLSETEAEPDKESVQQLKQAKESWEEFRRLFCKSVSKTYGGAWAGVHESECRANLAKQLQITIDDNYGW